MNAIATVRLFSNSRDVPMDKSGIVCLAEALRRSLRRHAVFHRGPSLHSASRSFGIPGALFYLVLGTSHALAQAQATTDPAAAAPARVEVTVTYQGAVPLSSVADSSGRKRPLFTVDRKTQGLAGAIVYLIPEKIEKELSAAEAAQLPPVVIDQRDEQFTPHVAIARPGQAVEFRNSDLGNHNVQAQAFVPANQFNVFTPVGDPYQHRFATDPRFRPILLSCGIHPWMRAWIYVLPHPWHALSDQRGRAILDHVPPGRHQLVVQQPDAGLRRTSELTVDRGQSLALAIELSAPAASPKKDSSKTERP